MARSQVRLGAKYGEGPGTPYQICASNGSYEQADNKLGKDAVDD